MSRIDYTNYPILTGTGPPPASKPTGYKIWSTPPGDPSTLFCISQSAQIVYTHWHPLIRRTVFCGGESCMMDHEKNAPEWTAYLLVARSGRTGKDAQVIWHITAGCANSCLQLVDASLDLRRARIKTWRAGKNIRSPILAETTLAYYHTSPMPRDHDLLAYLVDHFSAANNEARRTAKNGNTVT